MKNERGVKLRLERYSAMIQRSEPALLETWVRGLLVNDLFHVSNKANVPVMLTAPEQRRSNQDRVAPPWSVAASDLAQVVEQVPMQSHPAASCA